MEKIESNLAKLEERLAHEREKCQKYEEVLKEHESRCAALCSPGRPALPSDALSVGSLGPERGPKDLAFPALGWVAPVAPCVPALTILLWPACVQVQCSEWRAPGHRW